MLKIKKFFKENGVGYVFMLPLVLGLAILTVYPVVQALIISFYEYDGFATANYIGFDNFVRAFTIDTQFWKVVGNTFLYAFLNVPFTMILSYLLALFVNKNIKGISVFRTLFYLPCVIPGIVMGVMWGDFMAYPSGAFNEIFAALGLPRFTFLSVASTSMASLFIMGLWGIGGGMILWLAALKNIPAAMYEAADIDGAGKAFVLFRITIPMSTTTIFYNLIVGVIGTLQINSTLIFAPGGTGIDNSLYFFSVKIYKEAFQRSSMGYASALAWILAVVIGLITIVLFKTSGWVYAEDENV